MKRKKSDRKRDDKKKSLSREKESKHICNNCGAEVDTNRNICMRCGVFYNPIQSYFAEKVMQDQNLYSTWLSEAPSFKGMGREVNYNEGLKYLEKMQLNEALKFYENTVKEQPSNATNWNNLGVSFMGLKDRKNALKCYEKALEINPNYYIGLYNKGAVYYECEEYEKAINFFDKALAINPKCGEALWDKNIANEKLGNFEFGVSLELMKMGINTMRAQMNRSSALVDIGNGMDAVLGYYTLFLKNNDQLNKCFDEAVEFLKKDNRNQALQVLNRCIEINPEDPKVLGLKARLHVRVNEWKEAFLLYDKITKVNANSIDGWMGKGLSLSIITKAKNDEALHCFNQVLRINPFHKKVKEVKRKLFITIFSESKNQGKFNEAMEIIDELISENPEDSNYLVDKGTIYADQNQIEKAFESFNSALKIDHRNLFAWLNKAALNFKQGNYASAYEFFNEALKINPNEEKAVQGRGFALMKIRGDDYNRQMDELKESLNDHSKVVVDLFNKGTNYFSRRLFDDALEFFDKALDIDKNFSEIWYYKAMVYHSQQNFRDAINCFNEVTKKNEKRSLILIDTLINTGVCHRKLGELDEALECYKKVVEIDPNNGDAWGNIGNIYLDKKMLTEAIQHFDKAIEAGSEQSGYSIIPKNSKGTALLQMEMFQEALELYEDVLNYNPVFTPSLVGKGSVLYKLKKLSEALEYFNMALKIEPNYVLAWYQKASILYDLEKFKQALECYEQVLKIDPNYLQKIDHEKIQELKHFIKIRQKP